MYRYTDMFTTGIFQVHLTYLYNKHSVHNYDNNDDDDDHYQQYSSNNTNNSSNNSYTNSSNRLLCR